MNKELQLAADCLPDSTYLVQRKLPFKYETRETEAFQENGLLRSAY
jgi:hypothetical protein